MARRAAAAARPACAVRFVRGRRGHRRGGARPHGAERHPPHAGSGGYHLDHLPHARCAGTSPSYPGAAGPPSNHRRRAAARTAVLSRVAATATAGARDTPAADDTSDNDSSPDDTSDDDTSDNNQEPPNDDPTP